MSDLIERAEAARRRLGLRQVVVATALGVTQGHYSKVANGRTPMSTELAERFAAWIDANSPDENAAADVISHQISTLAESIQRQCMELLRLTARGMQAPVNPLESATSEPRGD